jgi:hypothetical protein
MAGIGKSLLAEEYSLRFAAAYPGGVFWLRAFGHDDASEPLAPEGRVAQRDAQLLGFARDLGLDTSDLPPDQLPGALARELDVRAQSLERDRSHRRASPGTRSDDRVCYPPEHLAHDLRHRVRRACTVAFQR